jgi:hypothetical protein
MKTNQQQQHKRQAGINKLERKVKGNRKIELTEKISIALQELFKVPYLQADGYFMDANIVNTGKNAKSLFENENGKMHYDVIMNKLQQITGLDMGLNASNLPEKFQRNLNQERR